MAEFTPITLFKAIRRPDGKNVCIDVNHLGETCRVFRNERDFTLAKSLGWADSPQEAMSRLEAAQDEVSTNAAIRAYDDRRMSSEAQAESAAVEAQSPRHLEEIPVQKRRPGRPRKTTVQ